MTRRLWWALILVAAIASPAYAQIGYGVRAGVSGSPAQFVFGGHLETKELAPHLTFRPNVDVGLGNGATVVGLNFDFAYWLPTKTDPWKLYVGAGPAAVITHVSVAGFGNTSTGGAFDFSFGAQNDNGLFAEIKLIAGSGPGVKFFVGYAFKKK